MPALMATMSFAEAARVEGSCVQAAALSPRFAADDSGKRASPARSLSECSHACFYRFALATEESCRVIAAMGRFVFVWFQYVNKKHALLTVFDWGRFRENPRRGRYTKFSIGPKHFAPPKSGRIDAGEISRKSGPALEIPSKIGKRIVESLFSSPMPIKTGFELFLDSALRQNFLISPE